MEVMFRTKNSTYTIRGNELWRNGALYTDKFIETPWMPEVGKIMHIIYEGKNGEQRWIRTTEVVDVSVPQRGFAIIEGFEGAAVIPRRSTAMSAGYDIVTPQDIVLQPGEFKVFPTGIKVFMQPDEVFKIFIRSSIGINHRIKLMNGTCVIDADYYGNPNNDGHFMLALENHSDTVFTAKSGSKIAQGIFSKYLLADGDNSTGKRMSGIGSTGE